MACFSSALLRRMIALLPAVSPNMPTFNSFRISCQRLEPKLLASSAQGATVASWSTRRSFGSSGKFRSEDEKLAYLREANRTLQKYEDARQLFKLGKLKGQQGGSSERKASSTANFVQIGVLSVFVVAFMTTPFIGKKIATDEEFRAKWVPSWYDYTVKKPENPWTREELHEQMLRVQKDLRERAIRGEFTKEKLEEMRQTLEYHHLPGRADMKAPSNKKVPKGWDRIHPGVDNDSDVNED
jgi:hypothetical protein